MARKKSVSVEQELNNVSDQLDKYGEQIKSLTLDEANKAPKLETEMQTKMSQKEIEASKGIWLKPKRTAGPGVHPKTGEKEKFNEKFRADYEHAKEYVQFIAENKEIIGETIELWTKPFAGIPAEQWEVPPNKPVWGPRYLAERIKNSTYHRYVMTDHPISSDHAGTYYGTMTAKNTIQRLDAHPVSNKKSIFTGASGF